MLVFDIRLRQGHVPVYHSKRGMAQQLLQDEDIPAGPQELHGEGVSEGMGTAPSGFNAAGLSQPLDKLQQPGAGERIVGLGPAVGQEHGSLVIAVVGCLGQVLPDRLAGRLAQRQCPLLVALAKHRAAAAAD